MPYQNLAIIQNKSAGTHYWSRTNTLKIRTDFKSIASTVSAKWAPYICIMSELLKKFPRFPFETLFISYGIENWKQHSYRIWSTRFIKILEKSFNDENIEEFKKIFKLHMILHALQVLPSPYNSRYYEFYEKRLAGQKKQISQQELSLELIKTYLINFNGHLK